MLDRRSNFRYAKYYLILSRNVAAEAFQVLLNLKFSETRNKPVLLKPHLSWISFKKKDNQATSILQPIVKAVLDRHHPKKLKRPFHNWNNNNNSTCSSQWNTMLYSDSNNCLFIHTLSKKPSDLVKTGDQKVWSALQNYWSHWSKCTQAELYCRGKFNSSNSFIEESVT